MDAKGRLSIPARFRRIFEACDPDWETGRRPQLVIVYGPSSWQHLELYTMEAIEEIDAQIDGLPRGSRERLWLERLMNGTAEDAEIDNDGRLLLPLKLREKLGLDDRAFIMASGDYLRLWHPDTYAEVEGNAVDEFAAEFPPDFDPRSFLKPLEPAQDDG